MKRKHIRPFGAETMASGGVRFRIWAPSAERTDLCLLAPERRLAMKRAGDGWFEVVARDASAGTRYRFQINGGTQVPDPASRFQPGDVDGASEVVEPLEFEWDDVNWKSRPWEETVLYELHVGTFTPEGTFAAAATKLDYLADLGITAIELMPVADFPGKRNWGYDGVLPYAPDSSYGTPGDLKNLIQTAHRKDLMVFLDVVYNHFGPEGNYLRLYSPQFFTDRHRTPWGEAINFDGPHSRVVRDFFIHNALYWLEEFHFDGLRLDAVHAIVDDSQPDILTELAEAVRRNFGTERCIHLVLENERNAARYLERNGPMCPKLYNAQWNDDIHHAFHVLLTGESDGYYSDYAEHPLHQLGRCLAEGFAFQADVSPYHGGCLRGEASNHLPPTAFVSFLQNHDQVGNRAFGDRISSLASARALRAAVSILLLAPSPPLLFMGEEFGASSPFLFFCDFHGELARAVTEGRRNEFAKFARFSDPRARTQIPDPNSQESFLASKLNWSCVGDGSHAEWRELFRRLLALRKKSIVPLLRGATKGDAQFTIERDRVLRVQWRFADASLILIANMNDSASGYVGALPERALFAANVDAFGSGGGALPPWYAGWFLET